MKSSRRLPSDFSESAAYPLYAIDPAQDRAWVLHFTRDDYRRAAFLDQRALKHRDISGWTVTGRELNEALRQGATSKPLHWLFHIGHCGSTLVSRLLDLIPGTLGHREPLPLLALAQGRDHPAADRWLAAVKRLLARGFNDTQAVIVKPTSIVTTLAGDLLPGSGHACLLWVDLQTWLATMIRSESLVSSTLALEQLRLADMLFSVPAESIGSRLARSWLSEQLRWQRISAGASSRCMDLDFAAVLADPARATGDLARHFGLRVPGEWNSLIATSGLLNEYAKDASQPFDSSARQRELEAASLQYSAVIDEGLRWAHSELEHHDCPALRDRLQPL
jgi:hypothetical protein